MPLSPEDRATFLELVPALGDDVDPRAILHFARMHKDALLDELAAVPGVARVRASVLRLLPELVPERADWEPLLAGAGDALLQPPTDHPLDRLARHPAWIGLGLIELATLQGGWDEDPISRAVELASRAFEAAGAKDDVGEGEVLWAMAEEAAEVGWSSRAHLLMERVADATFASAERRGEALLVLGLSRVQRGEDGAALLAGLPDDDEVGSRTRTHAAWVLGQLALERGDHADARHWLGRAAQTVDRGEDPDVARRIDEAVAQLG